MIHWHERFYFSDGNLRLQVENTKYLVHGYLFETHARNFIPTLNKCRADYISAIPSLGAYVLKGIKRTDFDRFLSCLYPRELMIEEARSSEEWISILELASKWEFQSLCRRAINELDSLATPIEKVILGRKYDIPELRLPGYVNLCQSTIPLTEEDGERLGLHDVIKIYGIRQELWGQSISSEDLLAKVRIHFPRSKRLLASNDPESPWVVDREIKALLNKLTIQTFDSISDQIIKWANRSENQKDGRTLIQVIRLVFEKAIDEATWSEMYARLCRKIMEQISSRVQDEGIKSAEGKPIAGGQLFRKYLLNRCQEDFELGWVTKASKAKEDQAIKDANEQNGTDEVVLYSEECYAAQKAKRQSLGLIKFIGELFKLQMLTERIMHECIKKLLGNAHDPEEEEIKSLCVLMTTVGLLLDTQKGRAHMDVYFQRMKELTMNVNVSPLLQLMLQDVLALRERGWIDRNASAGPDTLAQIHEAAAKGKVAQEKESTISRGGSPRGGYGENHPRADGWAVAGGGDLSQLGRISRAHPVTTLTRTKELMFKSFSRMNSSSNMFSALKANEQESKSPKPGRKKLMLQPRTKPLEERVIFANKSVTPSEKQAPALSEEAANAQITEDVKEFFNVRDLDEAEVYFTTLPPRYHHSLVNKLVSSAVESKEPDARLVADLFTRAKNKGLCSPDAFQEGLTPMAEIVEDVAIDAPKAWSLFAAMVSGAELDERRRTRLASKSTNIDKVLGLLYLKEYPIF